MGHGDQNDSSFDQHKKVFAHLQLSKNNFYTMENKMRSWAVSCYVKKTCLKVQVLLLLGSLALSQRLLNLKLILIWIGRMTLSGLGKDQRDLNLHSANGVIWNSKYVTVGKMILQNMS